MKCCCYLTSKEEVNVMKSSHDYDIIDSIIETIESECEKMSKREMGDTNLFKKRN